MIAVLEPPSIPLLGHASPRIAPPLPARSDIAGFRENAARMNLTLMPWQECGGRYLTAIGPDDLHLYREVCIVVARQNGKTTLMQPYIIGLLLAGKRIMHIAQTRELPRVMFGIIADSIPADQFPKRRGKGGKLQTVWPRFGAGQEEIILENGGSYRISAANRGGSRGWTNDVVIIDELREMESFEVISAAEPTLRMSTDPQIVYLSNAGTDDSVVLNSVRARASEDESLAYLEWSAAPERKASDVEGWAEANPALGHYPSVMRSLEKDYRKHSLAGTMSIFETESLCRWVITMRERLVDEYAWSLCEVPELPAQRKPYMAVSMDPKGHRASAILAWRTPGTDDAPIAVRLLLDATGDPIDTDRLGPDLRKLADQNGVLEVGGDPLTDGELGKFFRKFTPIRAGAFANASSRFVLAAQNRKVMWHDADELTDDLAWTTRKEHDESGSFQAVRADDDRPITASLAAIRAVYMASNPVPTGEARIW
jgi:hypothetical protein